MSIYCQITTRCNMRCAHCGFACTNRGKDMSELVFRRVLAFCIRNRIGMTLGGGEPTIHPQFWKWLTYARKRFAPLFEDLEGCTIGLVTNGSNTEMSLKLAEMARVGKIWAAVSKDQYHDEIDPRVFEAFRKNYRPIYEVWPEEARREQMRIEEKDHRDIRTVSIVRSAGRAKGWGYSPLKRWSRKTDKHTVGEWCCGMHVDPDGKMWECNCRKVLICDFSKSAGRKVDLRSLFGEDYTDLSCTGSRLNDELAEKAAQEEAAAKRAEEELMLNFKLEGELVKAS